MSEQHDERDVRSRPPGGEETKVSESEPEVEVESNGLADEVAPRPRVGAADAEAVHGGGFIEHSKRWLEKLEVLRKRFQSPWQSGESLLELAQTVRRELEDALEPLGGGRRVFPYAAARVTLRPRSTAQESLFRAALAEGWEDELRATSLHHLRECGAQLEALDLTVEVESAPSGEESSENSENSESERSSESSEGEDDSAPAHAAGERRAVAVRFEKYLRDSSAGPGAAASIGAESASSDGEQSPQAAPDAGAPSPRAPATTLRLVVEQGSASQSSYEVRGRRVALGRMEDVFDQHGRIRRRNDIAFDDEGEINGTVSREHARILYRAESDDYWLVDDRSSYGTRIFREGQAIDVSSRDRRGVRLRSGDRVYLGRAVLACEIETA